MKNPNLDEIADIIANVAETEVMPRFRNLSVSDIATKTSADDLVTTAHTETEKVLTARLTEALPDSLVVGEEACFQNPEVVDYLKQDKPVWVIDPVDGTLNFSYGRSEFGMVVALVSKGETVAGWLYNPVMKAMIYGEKGAVKAGAIKLKYDEDSLIFSISYTDSSETAAKEKLAAIIQSLDKNVNFMGADEARVTPVQNEATVIADNGIVKCSLIGFAVGLVVAVAIALVAYILDNTVKDAEELEEISGANLLAKISYDDGKNK